VTVRNRYRDLRGAYGRPAGTSEPRTTAADGTGAESDPSVRLFARGMAGEAVEDVEGLAAAEVGAAAVVAGARREEAAIDITDVAASAGVEARAISRALEDLEAAIDVDIPRPAPGELIDEVTGALDVSETTREESRRALEGFDAEDSEYTARELAAGAVAFAATVGEGDVDVGDVASAGGADREYVEAAMREVLVVQCLGLVRGDVAYEECAWTAELQDADLPTNAEADGTAPAVGVARTYVAGREGDPVDDGTLETLLTED
jgi:hypothetical protein